MNNTILLLAMTIGFFYAASNERTQQKGGWISVEERLPEGSQIVMAYATRATGEHIMQEVHHCPEYGFDVEDQSYLQKPVTTHWQPLPQPPMLPVAPSRTQGEK